MRKTMEQNMMSTKCSSHFIEAYDDYKRSLWKSREEERLQQMRTNGRFLSPNTGACDQIIVQNIKDEQTDTFSEDIDTKEPEDGCVWRTGKRESIYTASLSASNLERLQLLTARRNTLPENVFSQLRDKCSLIQSRRNLPTLASEDDEDDDEDDDGDGDDFAEEEANLADATRLLILRSRQLSAAMQNKPHHKKEIHFEETPTFLLSEGTQEKITFPNIKAGNNRKEHHSRQKIERRRGMGTRGPLAKSAKTKRNKIDINESLASPVRPLTSSSHVRRNVINPSPDNNTSSATYTKTNSNLPSTTYTKTSSNLPSASSEAYNSASRSTKVSSSLPSASSEANNSVSRRNVRLFSNAMMNSTKVKDEMDNKVCMNELKSCRYLRQNMTSMGTCTCDACDEKDKMAK